MATSTAVQAPVHDLKRGILLITLAFLFSAVMSAFGKAAADIPPLLLLFFQYCISFLVFVPSGVRAGPQVLKTNHFFLQAFRSVAGSVCQLLFFVSVKSLPLMDAVLLSNAAPLFIPLIVYVWFRKTVQPVVWLSLFIGLIGIVMIIHPGAQMFRSPASLIALGAGLCSALALVATNRLSETEPPTRILIYNFGISTILLVPACIWAWKPLTLRDWELLLAVGAFYALTQYFIIRAYHYASAVEISPFNYTVVIFSGLLGWWVFGNMPSPAAILGTLLICAGGILSTRTGHREGYGHPFGTGHWSLWWPWRARAQVSS